MMRKFGKHRKTALLLAAVVAVSGVLDGMGLPVRDKTGRESVPVAAAAEYTAAPTAAPIEWKAIRDAGDLYAIRDDLDGCYYLENDIDLSEVTAEGGEYDIEGHGWEPIDNFTGRLDGRGYRIIGMHIFGKMNNQDVGLFGTTTNAVFCNLGIVDCNIDVSGADTVGSLVGKMQYWDDSDHRNCSSHDHCFSCEYKDTNCFSTGSITVDGVTSASIGGMIGWLYSSDNVEISLTDLYNLCDIRCTSSSSVQLGGLLGYSESNYSYDELSFSNCYNAGEISVADSQYIRLGAFTGADYYRDVYYHQAVSYTSCFWLEGTADSIQGNDSGYQADSATCKSLTAAQMKNQKLFTGFDFDDTWEFDPHCGYPYPQLQGNRQIRPVSLRVIRPDAPDTPAASGSSVAVPEPVSCRRGETLDIRGWKLEVMYEKAIGDPILLPLSMEMLSGYDMEQEGRQTVTVTYGGAKASFDILVLPVAVESVQISDSSLEMYRGDTCSLEASVAPANASEQGIVWSSSDDSVVSVDEEGNLMARKRGTVTITAASEADQTITAVCEVVVQVAATVITLDRTALSLTIGQRESITAEMLPLDATEAVTWESEDQAVAQVETDADGNVSVYAVGGGETTIWAMTEKNGLEASCAVTVHGSEEPPQATAGPTAVPGSTDPGTTAPTAAPGTAEPTATPQPTAASYLEDETWNIGDRIEQTKAKIAGISAGKRRFRVRLKGKNQYCSYQLQYAKKPGMKSPRYVRTSSNSVTVKGLQKKTYYVRVRAYGYDKGELYYGPWSAKKKIKIRK